MEKFVSVVVPKERREVGFFFSRSKPEEFFLAKVQVSVVGKQEKAFCTSYHKLIKQ